MRRVLREVHGARRGFGDDRTLFNASGRRDGFHRVEKRLVALRRVAQGEDAPEPAVRADADVLDRAEARRALARGVVREERARHGGDVHGELRPALGRQRRRWQRHLAVQRARLGLHEGRAHEQAPPRASLVAELDLETRVVALGDEHLEHHERLRQAQARALRGVLRERELVPGAAGKMVHVPFDRLVVHPTHRRRAGRDEAVGRRVFPLRTGNVGGASGGEEGQRARRARRERKRRPARG